MNHIFYPLAIIFLVLNCIHAINGDEIEQSILVDQLTKDYLKVEQELWVVIEKREDSTLQQIYNVHTQFLNRYYGESNVFLSGLYLNSNPIVINSIIAINETSHDIAREFFEHRNYSVLSLKAFNGVNLDKTFNVIVDETVNSTDFWINVKNLTEECQLASRSVQSEHQVLFEYYKDIQAAALRTYITAQLSYMILHLHESGNFREQSIAYQKRFRDINAEIREVFKSKLKTANKDVWTCDPVNLNVPGVNHEITKFLQGYIDNEVNLNADGSCALTCADYQHTKHHECHPDTLCAELKPEKRATIQCKGKVRGCYGLEDSLTVCPSENGEGRYKYVKSSTGLKLGNATSCSYELKANAWIRWFVKCSNCFCLCDDTTGSERHFSLRNVVSNIEQNRVVTGIQLTKQNGVIQFAIAERELHANGHIDNILDEHAVWKIAPQFNVTDNRTKNGIDYYTLTYENRSVNLDTIIAPVGQVVTGVRFNRNAAGHLILQIRVTDIDIVAGKLINLERSIWLSNSAGGKHRINTDNVDVSTKATRPSVPNVKENTFVRFGPTHKKIDVSQRTVPFIESLKVEPKIPVPLAGIGLYYKGQTGYGGFIAPKIIVYDFEPYIEQN